jgi:transposase
MPLDSLVEDRYACSGRPSVDPVVFFRLQLVIFFEDIRSERPLMELAADRLSIRWFLGYDLDEPLPDHSSLTRIRERYGLEIFRRFFETLTLRSVPRDRRVRIASEVMPSASAASRTVKRRSVPVCSLCPCVTSVS